MIQKTKILLISLLTTAVMCIGREYKDRWFYASCNLQKTEQVDAVCALMPRAKAGGLNGVLLSAGLENLWRMKPTQLDGFAKVLASSRKNGIEIIPIIWSIGYGTMLGEEPNLAAAVPTTVTMQAKDGWARIPETLLSLKNPSFEQGTGNNFPGWNALDSPGTITFRDNTIASDGKSSVRLENFTANKHGHGRLLQNITVQPHRNYQITVSVRTEGYDNVPNPKAILRLQTYTPMEVEPASVLNGMEVPVRSHPEGEWFDATFTFQTGEYTSLRFYAGVYGGTNGKLWLDNFRLYEKGMADVILREGTPFRVFNKRTGVECKPNTDYVLPPCFLRDKKYVEKNGLPLKLLPGGSIRDGDLLDVSYYQASRSGSKQQLSTCMSTKKIYELFALSAAGIRDAFNPRKWFLSMDEVRNGGTCEACRKRNITMGQMFGDCVTRQYNIIKSVRTDAEVYIWSDMLDPGHNAVDHYYGLPTTFKGSWECIPKDIIISCWYMKKMKYSMDFFTANGFRVQCASYYDQDDLDMTAANLDVCNHTRNCTGMIYTSWQRKYQLLESFGELLRKKSAPAF